MEEPTQHFKTFLVRKLPKETYAKLKFFCSRSEYPSFNDYIKALLMRVADQEGLTDFEMRIKKENQRLSAIIEKNTDAILDVIDYLDFD